MLFLLKCILHNWMMRVGPKICIKLRNFVHKSKLSLHFFLATFSCIRLCVGAAPIELNFITRKIKVATHSAWLGRNKCWRKRVSNESRNKTSKKKFLIEFCLDVWPRVVLSAAEILRNDGDDQDQESWLPNQTHLPGVRGEIQTPDQWMSSCSQGGLQTSYIQDLSTSAG